MAGVISASARLTSAIAVGSVRITFLCRCNCNEQSQYFASPAIIAPYPLGRRNSTPRSKSHRQTSNFVLSLAMDSPSCDAVSCRILSHQSLSLFRFSLHVDIAFHRTHAALLDPVPDPGLHLSSSTQASDRRTFHSYPLLCARGGIPVAARKLAPTTVCSSSYRN